jgi:uncharacterized protein (DUF952 family)
MSRQPIYHICANHVWRALEEGGNLVAEPPPQGEGFLHFSTADQLAESASIHFVGREDVVLLTVDLRRLSSELKWEPSRGGALFPHLYGPLPHDAVMRAELLSLGSDGNPVIPPLLNEADLDEADR